MRRLAIIGIIIGLCFCIIGLPDFAQAQTSRPDPKRVRVLEQRVQVLEKQLVQVDRRVQDLVRSRSKQLAQLKMLGEDIKRLKADKQKGMLEQMRLRSLLARHLEQSRDIETLESRISSLKKSRDNIRKRLRSSYGELSTLIAVQITHEKDRNKALALLRKYLETKNKGDSYRDKSKAPGSITPFSVTLNPLDGPREISEKIELLKDRIRKLKDIIRKIEQEIGRLKHEKGLADEMRQMIEEGNLFEDGVKFMSLPRNITVRRDDADPTDMQPLDDADLYAQPVGDEGSKVGVEHLSIVEREILRLEAEKKFLTKVIADLENKIQEFQKQSKIRAKTGNQPPRKQPGEGKK